MFTYPRLNTTELDHSEDGYEVGTGLSRIWRRQRKNEMIVVKPIMMIMRGRTRRRKQTPLIRRSISQASRVRISFIFRGNETGLHVATATVCLPVPTVSLMTVWASNGCEPT
jgi:hypothetical protein